MSTEISQKTIYELSSYEYVYNHDGESALGNTNHGIAVLQHIACQLALYN